MRTLVTDPDLLRSLNGAGPEEDEEQPVVTAQPGQMPAGRQPVTDPDLLRSLNEGLDPAEVRPSTLQAVDTDPQRYARARELETQTGIPADVIAMDPGSIERDIRLRQLDEIAQQYPATGRLLANPDTAKLAHGEAEQLAETESLGRMLVKPFVDFGSAAAAMVPAFNTGLWGVVQAVGDVTGTDMVSEFAKARAEEQQALQKRLTPETDNWALDAAYGGVTSAAQSLSLAPFGVGALLAGFALTSGGTEYNRAREQGIDPLVALAYATAQGGVEAITESFSAKFLIDLLGGAGKNAVLSTMKNFAAREAIGEQVATVWQDFNEWIVLNPEKTLKEFVAERPGAAAETLVSTIVSVGMSTTVGQGLAAARERREQTEAKAREATIRGASVGELMASAERASLRSTDPAAFHQLVHESTAEEDGSPRLMFIEGESFAQSLEESGISVEQLDQFAPGLAAQIAAAVESSGDVVLPVADAVTVFAGTPVADILTMHSRSTVDSLSMAEAQAIAEAFAQINEENAELAEGLPEGATPADVLASTPDVQALNEQAAMDRSADRAQMAWQAALDSAGRFDAETNSVQAAVAAAMTRTMAEDLGMTAEEFLSRFPPRVVALLTGAPADTLDQGDRPYRAALSSEEITSLDMAAIQAMAPSARLDGGTFTVLPSERAAAATAAAEQGVNLPNDSLDQTVYHGTPHIFNRFDLSKIGTGEGAQVYGWGIYFAESRAVADKYRRSLTGDHFVYIVDGERVPRDENTPYGGPKDTVLSAIADGTSIDELVEFFRWVGDEGKARALEENMERYRGATVTRESEKGTGALYSLNVPDGAVLLDRDEMLTDQSPEVQAAVLPLLRQMDRDGWQRLQGTQAARPFEPASDAELLDEYTGGSFYDALESDLGSKKAASEALDSLGVVGLRYLDAGSRGKSDGTRNLVIWNQPLLDQISADMNRELFQKMGAEDARGRFFPSTMTIALLEKANLSTFLHELGHLGLEMMVDIASQPNAPQRIVDNTKAALKWLGVADLQTWQKMTHEQRRPYHEKFAEGFETYLFEGRAPAPELVDTFSRVRSWMISVYKRLTNMGVQLDDEIRSVFDRMIATDAQIEAAAEQRAMAPLFGTPEQAAAMGVDAQTFASYWALGEESAQEAVSELESRSLRDMKWLGNAKSRELRRRQSEAKKTRRAVRAEVQAEVDAQPVYGALQFILKGTDAREDLTNAQRKAIDSVAGSKTKLSLPALKELYGDGPAAPWRYLPRSATTSTDGAHPDAVAAAFGFDSGDAMIRAIVAAEDRGQLIEGLTDRRMIEQHTELSSPEAIEDAANEALHNKSRARFVATEVKFLTDGLNAREVTGTTTYTISKGKRAGLTVTRDVTVNGLERAARQHARGVVNNTPVWKLNAAQHSRAASKSAREAQAAMRAGDTALALRHKRNQMLSEALVRETNDAKAEFDRSQRFLRKYANSNRARGAIAADYVEQIEGVLAMINTRVSSNKRIASRQSLREWIAKREADGLPVPIDTDMLESLSVADIRELPMETLRALVDQVRILEHTGKLKKRLLTARDKRAYEEVVDSLVAQVQETGGKVREQPFAPGSQEYAKGRLFARFLAQHRKLASYARQFDGGEDGGLFWRTFIRPMNEAGNRETSLLSHAATEILDIFREVEKLPGGMTRNKILINSLGKSLSREERLAVAMNYGNELSRQRVHTTLTQEQVDEIFSHLTAVEWKAVQDTWDFLDSFWPDVAAKEKRVTGVAPERVEASPFTVTVEGQQVLMRGGYYPIVYESELSDAAATREAAEIAKGNLAGAFSRRTTNRSHTKARAKETAEPLRFNLDVIEWHTAQVIHDLAWHEWLIDANRLLAKGRLADTIRAHHGPAALESMRNTLDAIATGDIQRRSAVSVYAGKLRSITTAAVMGWSFTTALLQPFGLFQSIPRVGGVWILRGMRHWAGDAARLENSARLIREKSEMMRHRSITFNRDIRDVSQRLHRGRSRAGEVAEASLFFTMQKLQLVADIPTWYGAYEKALAENPNDESRAVALADSAVLEAQGGGTVKDLAGVSRGNELLRSLSMFYSYFSATHNLIAESTGKTKLKNPKTVAGWLSDMVLLTVIPVLAQMVVFSALRGGDDDDDEEFLKEFGQEWLGFMLSSVIGAREFSGMVQGFDYNGPALYRTIARVGDLTKVVGKALDPDEELDSRDYRKAMTAVFTGLGWPAAQLDRSWRGWEAYEEGEAGPGAILLGPPPRR